MGVQSFRDLADHPFGHGAVDLASQFYEMGVDAVFLRFPGQVERVDGDATKNLVTGNW